jgi:hypothetical protein
MPAQATRALVRRSRSRKVDSLAQLGSGGGRAVRDDALAAQEDVGLGLVVDVGSCCDGVCVKVPVISGGGPYWLLFRLVILFISSSIPSILRYSLSFLGSRWIL